MDTWLHRLARGEYGLRRTYWLGWWLGNTAAIVFVTLLIMGAATVNTHLAVALAWACGMAVYLGYNVLAMIGIWRAAGDYPGWGGWAIWARINVGFAWLGLAYLAVCIPIVFLRLLWG